MQLLKMQHVIASTGCFAMNEFLPTECVKAKLYPLIAPLGETLLPLQDIQAGVMSVSAGLLSGKYFKIIGKYLPVRDIRDTCLLVLACSVLSIWRTLSFSPFTREP